MSITSSSALSGLSGYDFDSIVEMMTATYSQPLTRMQEQQSVLQTKKDAWRDVNTRLSSLENALTKLRNSATWAGTSATSSNVGVLSVSSATGTTQGTYNIKVVQMAAAQTAVSGKIATEETSAATSVTGGTFTITAGDKSTNVRIEAGASLDDIVKAINNSKAGVTASAVKVEGGYKIALLSSETGVSKAAVFSEAEGGNVLHSLGILKEDHSLNISQAAKDTKLEINGISEITSSSNKITTAVPGLTLTINSESVDTSVTVKVAADYSGAQAAVQSFVDQYNSVMTFIEGKLSYNKDLKTKGDLYADPALQGIQSRLRNMVSSNQNNPSGVFNILADVGITTSADNFGKSATLTFDTTKFNEAIEKNASSVANLFGAPAGGVDPNRESGQGRSAQGLANRLYEYIHPLVMYDGTLAKTSNSYEKQITDLKDKMTDFAARVERYSEATRLKFSRLETQLAALSNQSDWLKNQLTSLYNPNDDK